MKKSENKKAEALFDLFVAAMKDAAIERKMTQLKTTITPHETGKEAVVRIIVVPETMDYEWPHGMELP